MISVQQGHFQLAMTGKAKLNPLIFSIVMMMMRITMTNNWESDPGKLNWRWWELNNRGALQLPGLPLLVLVGAGGLQALNPNLFPMTLGRWNGSTSL